MEEWLSRRVPLPPSGTRRLTIRPISRAALGLEIVIPVRPVQQLVNSLTTLCVRLVGKRALAAALSLMLSLGVASARDSLMSSPYGPVVSDLLKAFTAEETLCPLSTYQHDLCFAVELAGAGYLAERLESVVATYSAANLRSGGWRAANGVWSVTLTFGGGHHGSVELFLTEVGQGSVRGTFVFHEPR